MDSDLVQRVHYFDRQFLGAADFRVEQDYHLQMRRRLNIAQHTWGIAYGLEVRSENTGLLVSPGVALDGYGRELVLPQPRHLDADDFRQLESEELDVWMEYGRQQQDDASESEPCLENDAASSSRWRELPTVYFARPDLLHPDPRKPQAVPEDQQSFGPHQAPPDEPRARWPVFLGRVRRNVSGNETPFAIDGSLRPYAGLRGEAIVSPSGEVSVQVGKGAPQDPYRFAVRVRRANAAMDAQEPPDAPNACVLGVRPDGALELKGEATISGNLLLDGGAIEFRDGTPLPQPGTRAAEQKPDLRLGPWRILHWSGTPEVDGRSSTNGSNPLDRHELRIMMAKDAANRNAVVIGAWSPDDGKFKQCLRIEALDGAASDGTKQTRAKVTVFGDLIVHGKPNFRGGEAEAPLSQQARQFLLTALTSALNQAAQTNTTIGAAANLFTRPGSGEIVATVFLQQQSGAASSFVHVILKAEFLPQAQTLLRELLNYRPNLLPERDPSPGQKLLTEQIDALWRELNDGEPPAEPPPFPFTEPPTSYIRMRRLLAPEPPDGSTPAGPCLPAFVDLIITPAGLKALAERLTDTDLATLLQILRDDHTTRFGQNLTHPTPADAQQEELRQRLFDIGAQLVVPSGQDPFRIDVAERLLRGMMTKHQHGRTGTVKALAMLAGVEDTEPAASKNLRFKTTGAPLKAGINAAFRELNATDDQKKVLLGRLSLLGTAIKEVADELAGDIP